jgi:hypothetical protein
MLKNDEYDTHRQNAETGGTYRNGIYGSKVHRKTVLAGRASSQRTSKERVRRGPSNLEGNSICVENMLLSSRFDEPPAFRSHITLNQ